MSKLVYFDNAEHSNDIPTNIKKVQLGKNEKRFDLIENIRRKFSVHESGIKLKIFVSWTNMVTST